MTEKSIFWNLDVGDDGPYAADEFADLVSFMYQHDKTTEAVIKYMLNELLPTNTGLTITVATGKAIVDGSFFINSSIWSSVVAVPGAGDVNYYNLVLQKDWSSQEVRLTLLGPSTVSTPSITQTAGTLWEIGISDIEVTDAGGVTLTDKRVFCAMPMHIITNAIADQQITSQKILASCIDSTKLAAGLFPYAVEGEIACKGLGIGDLQVISQDVAGSVLSHRGLSLPPVFSKSIDGCILSYSGTYTFMPTPGNPVPFDIVDLDQNPWGIPYASIVDPTRPNITIPEGIPDTVYLVFCDMPLSAAGGVPGVGKVRAVFLFNGSRHTWGTSVVTGESEISSATSSYVYGLSFCIPMLLKGGDFLTLYGVQDGGGSYIAGYHFGIIAIGS
jgi:hypothetical protein